MNDSSFDVCVIGGGLIGLLSARELALAGKSVVLLERGQCGKESSWAGGGILSPLYPWRYAPAVNQLARWSQANYGELCRQLVEETGIDPQWTRSGIILLDEDEITAAQEWASAYPMHLDILDTSGLRSEEPELRLLRERAMFFPDVAQVRNPRLLAALLVHVRQLGVHIREQAPVTGFIQQTGCISAVSTDRDKVSAGEFVLASGAWSASVADSLDDKPLIRPIKGQMLLFRGAPGMIRHMVMDKGRYVIPRRDGRVLVGSTLEDVGFDKQTTELAREELMTKALSMFPCLSDAQLETQWAGLRPGKMDGIPYICRHPEYANLFLNSGHFRNGVVLGLASARLLADLVLGREPLFSVHSYQL